MEALLAPDIIDHHLIREKLVMLGEQGKGESGKYIRAVSQFWMQEVELQRARADLLWETASEEVMDRLKTRFSCSEGDFQYGLRLARKALGQRIASFCHMRSEAERNLAEMLTRGLAFVRSHTDCTRIRIANTLVPYTAQLAFVDAVTASGGVCATVDLQDKAYLRALKFAVCEFLGGLGLELYPDKSDFPAKVSTTGVVSKDAHGGTLPSDHP